MSLYTIFKLGVDMIPIIVYNMYIVRKQQGTHEMTMQFVAITDETHVCDCCGKTNLKRVVVLKTEDGEYVRYGTTCASRVLGKAAKTTCTALVDYKTYVDKWIIKYSPEIVVKGLWEKIGIFAKYEDNKIQVKLNNWVTVWRKPQPAKQDSITAVRKYFAGM